MSRYSRSRSSSLFVRNVSDRVRYEEIKKLFERYGRVVDVTIPLDYYTRLPKGFCFVEFEDSRDAEDALYHLDRVRLHGRDLEIEFARGERKTPADMRNRDRERRELYHIRYRSRSGSSSRSGRRSKHSRSRDRRSRERSSSSSRRRSRSESGRSYRRSSSSRRCLRSSSRSNRNASHSRSRTPAAKPLYGNNRSKSPST